jgi:hypothetical protein
MPIIRLPDGSEQSVTVADVAASIGAGLASFLVTRHQHL